MALARSVGDYLDVHQMAFEGGIRARGLRPGIDRPPQGRERQAFVAACHRGFEKAQDRILDLIEEHRSDSAARPAKDQTELLLRDIANGISFDLFERRTYELRRMVLLDRVPFTPIEELRRAQREAHRLNRESRLTFALLADLTTNVHVADIIRIDFRKKERGPELIELKSGSANVELLRWIEEHDTETPAVLEELERDEAIGQRFKAQGRRMLRQRLRLSRISEYLENDVGVDNATELRILTNSTMVQEEDYSAAINRLCDEATKHGQASTTIDQCIHIAAVCSSGPLAATRDPKVALKAHVAQAQVHASAAQVATMQEVKGQIGSEAPYTVIDPIPTVLQSMSVFPFSKWRLNRDNRLRLITGELQLALAFDISGFIALARAHGLDVGLSTRRESEKHLKTLGRKRASTWGHRLLEWRTDGHVIHVLGWVHRFVRDLSRPEVFVEGVASTQDELLEQIERQRRG